MKRIETLQNTHKMCYHNYLYIYINIFRQFLPINIKKDRVDFLGGRFRSISGIRVRIRDSGENISGGGFITKVRMV